VTDGLCLLTAGNIFVQILSTKLQGPS